MRVFRFSLWTIVMCVACTGDPDFDLGGSWTLSETFSSQTGISCTVTGSLLIAHQSTSSVFGGIATRNATCNGAPPDFDPGGADEVINADISGSDVEFQVDLCDYVGVVGGNEMDGSFMCEYAVSGQPVQFDGTWQATRTGGS